MLTDLAIACRKSGLLVIEVGGWKSRGHGSLASVETIVVHHTGTAASAPGDYPSLGIVRDGRSDLPGPLSQIGLGRDGTVYVIGAGVAYHAGETWRDSQGNWQSIGIEAEHDGLSPWPDVQYDAYVLLCAALCEHYGLTPERVQGHKEVAKPQGRKVDPTFDMDSFRAAVADAMQEDDMAQHADQLDSIETKVDQLLKKAENSAERERATNALLRKLRADVKDAATLAEIDALLSAG